MARNKRKGKPGTWKRISGTSIDATPGRRWYGMNWIRQVKRLAIYIRDGFSCCYCFRNLADAGPAEISLDHLRPRSQGGSNDARNLVTACLICNDRRGDRPWKDFTGRGSASEAWISKQRRRVLNMALARSLRG